MNIKKNLNDMTGAAAELREGMKGVWLAKKIKDELDGGADLEDIVLRYVPVLDAATVYSDMDQPIFSKNSSLVDKNNKFFTINIFFMRYLLIRKKIRIFQTTKSKET